MRDKKIVVCQTMFLNTVNISKQTVHTAFKKLQYGDPIVMDKRGMSKTRPRAIDEAVTASVMEHINMFPRVDSHYIRKDSCREYLEEKLSLSKMYSLYVDWMTEKKKPMATKHHYYDIFNTKFNISFFKPKKDQCDFCSKFQNESEEEKEQLSNQYNIHIENKEKSRNLKTEEKIIATENKQSCMITFDFEKVLATPKTEASSLYYKRKLSVYNFTIYDVGRHEAYCYVWSENDARKGSNEVASCLLDYFEKRVSEGITDFFLWSDNCTGQNRNKNVFSMYVYASLKFNINIRHSFLEAGHTQNEGDSVHAMIERHAKGKKIYDFSEWCDIIKGAKLTKPNYQVITVNYNMIFDFKDLSSQMNWGKTILINRKKQTCQLKILQVKQISVSKENVNQLQYKTTFKIDWQILITRKGKENVNVKK